MPEKKHNILEILGAISGLGPEKAKHIVAEVKANLKALEECPSPHEFEPCEFLQGRIPCKHRCRKCGGTLGVREYVWYVRGLEHGQACR